MELKAKFWIENKGEVVLGGGKASLLLAVDRFGSIQRAADEFGMFLPACLGGDQEDRASGGV